MSEGANQQSAPFLSFFVGTAKGDSFTYLHIELDDDAPLWMHKEEGISGRFLTELRSSRDARRIAPPGRRYPPQNGISSWSSGVPSSVSVCLARLRKSTVSAMISQP